MVIEIGNRIGNGEGYAELRILREGIHHSTIHNSLFKRFEITESGTEIPYCEARIVGQTQEVRGLIGVGTELEVWAARTGQPLTLLIRAKVDFFEEETLQDAGGEKSIEFQARSVASPLMDNEYKGQLTGTVKDVVSKIAAFYKIDSMVEVQQEPVDVLLNCASAYGALRLIAVSLDSIVHVDRKGGLEFYSKQHALEKMREVAPKEILESDIKSSKVSEGHPIKKR